MKKKGFGTFCLTLYGPARILEGDWPIGFPVSRVTTIIFHDFSKIIPIT
jgi:hypothetical protein